MAYATSTDVLRVLGGTEDLLKERFGLTLWEGDVTEVTVDGSSFDVPDLVLARIEEQLEIADSKVNSYVLKQYRAKPTVVPASLKDATAKIAAFNSVTTDGTRTEYLREMKEDADAFLKDLAKGRVDLGIQDDPRPAHKAPALHWSRGANPNRRSSSRRCCP